MEIAEAHRKVHNELEENVSQFKFNLYKCNYNQNFIFYSGIQIELPSRNVPYCSKSK